jgi:hypothetical protein
MTKFPKVIYVQMEKDGNEVYPLAWKTAEETNDGKIAVYELKKVVNKSTKTIIE